MLAFGPILFGLLASPAAFQDAVAKKLADVPGFKVESFAEIKRSESGNPENVIRTFQLTFANDSNEAIVAAAVAFHETVNGKVVLTKGPFPAGGFEVPMLSSVDCALPGFHALGTRHIDIDMPSGSPASARFDFQITAIWALDWKGKQPKGFGNLYTWIRNSPEEDVLAGIARWPKLVRIKTIYDNPAISAFYAVGTAAEIKAFSTLPGAADAPSSRGITPLHMAALNERNPEALELALTAVKVPDPRNEAGTTPLMYALIAGRDANAQWLLEHGVNKYVYDKQGLPCWAYALSSPHPTVSLAMLVKYAVPVKTPDGSGLSLMHRAASKSSTDATLLSEIMSYGLTPNQLNQLTGETPLMLAAKARNFVAARWLIEHGARLDVADKLGRNILSYAREGDPFGSEDDFRNNVMAKVKLSKENGTLPKGQD